MVDLYSLLTQLSVDIILPPSISAKDAHIGRPKISGGWKIQ
jgi:hypothetical protein